MTADKHELKQGKEVMNKQTTVVMNAENEEFVNALKEYNDSKAKLEIKEAKLIRLFERMLEKKETIMRVVLPNKEEIILDELFCNTCGDEVDLPNQKVIRAEDVLCPYCKEWWKNNSDSITNPAI